MATEREIQLVEAALKAAAAECEQWNATPGGRLAKQIRSLYPAAIVASVPTHSEACKDAGYVPLSVDGDSVFIDGFGCVPLDWASYKGRRDTLTQSAALSAQEQVEPTDAERKLALSALIDADHLAECGLRLLAALNKRAGAKDANHIEQTATSAAELQNADELVSEYWGAVQSAAHEYRKRADRFRALLSANQGK